MRVDGLCVCPSCHAALGLVTDGLECTGCKRRFPIVDGVPILLGDPLQYLTQVSKQFEQAIARSEGVTQKVALAMDDADVAFRRPVMQRIIDAGRRRSALLRRQHAPVAAWLGGQAAAVASSPSGRSAPTGDAVVDSRYGPAALNYLRMDWSGDADAERQIQHIESTLLRQAQQYCDVTDGAVILGAGAGRLLFDLARVFKWVIGVDLSFPFVHAFHRLAVEELSASLIELVAPYSRDKIVIDFTARLPPDRTPLDRLVYPVADALELPVASQSVSTVIMTFFADVVPLPSLLDEIKRVLKPGGRVINFGTLNYHFSDFAWFLAPEEAEEWIKTSGFRFEEQSWSEMPFVEHPSTYSRSCRVWSYVLRVDDAPAAPP